MSASVQGGDQKPSVVLRHEHALALAERLDDALAAIATAAKVGHQRAEMIGHHAAYTVAGELELFVPPSTLPDLPK